MLYTIKEVAEKTRTSAHWIRQKIKQNKIISIRMGGKIFITEHELDKILQNGVAK